uniref:Immunoglobulin subtype domain-containing protein n=1 Tax=Oncorhynchus kisutch TaxID=8019 RepID=A0A8C7JFF0_ONCKI
RFGLSHSCDVLLTTLNFCSLSFRSDPCCVCLSSTLNVNGSEPLCITSMWSSVPTVHHQNGFQGRSMKMFMTNITIFLTITEVEVADSGLYFCGMSDTYFIFANATVLKVQGNPFNTLSAMTPNAQPFILEEDGTMNLFLLVVILGVVTAVLLIIILILVLEVRRDVNRLNTDPDALNYAALNFTSKKKERRGEKELDPHVVYAATR